VTKSGESHSGSIAETLSVGSDQRVRSEPELDKSILTEIPAGEQGRELKPWTAVRHLVYFAGLIVVLAFLMNAIITNGLRRERTSEFGVWNQVMDGRVNAQVVITGSSRAELEYDPRAIEAATGRSSFNLGRNGTQTDMQVAFFKAYLAHNHKPEIVLHNLDAFSFVTSREVFDPGQYVPYLYEPALYDALRKIDPGIWKSRYIPLHGYVVEDMNLTWIHGLTRFFGWSPREDYFLGFNPRHTSWTNEFESFKAANPNGVRFAIEPAGIQDLEELVRVCKQNGIQLIFVYAPEYGEMQALTANRAEIFAQFHEMAKRYDIPLWDYSDWKYNFDRDFFYNSQHLNATGSAVFSADLANRLERYYLAQVKSEDFPATALPPSAPDYKH
jgi:hypothetical protein